MVLCKNKVEECIRDIDNWMLCNNLKLNNDKTEFLLLHSKHRPKPPMDCIIAGDEHINVSDYAKNIGVLYDTTLSFDKHISTVCQLAFYHLRNISRVRKYLSYDTTKVLVHAFVTSKIDFCNSLLFGLPKHLIDRLQYVMNSAARVISRTRKYDHVTPILMELHWLPVEQRIKYKILVLVYKALNGNAPMYLNELLTRYQPLRSLRSSNKGLLLVPKFKLKSYGARAFSVCGPALWNGLPENLRLNTNSFDSFKKNLKTHLYREAYVN